MKNVTMPASVKSLVVDSDGQRRALVEELLRNMGYSTIESRAQISDLNTGPRAVHSQNLILVLCEDTVESSTAGQLKEFLEIHPMPVLLLAENIDKNLMTTAMKAGVTAFLSLSVQTNRIEQAIDSAFANYSVIKDLQAQIIDLSSRLEDRITIDKAKGLVMKNKGLDEAQAYGFLRDYAMNQGRKLVDVAGMIIDTAALLEK